MIPEEDVRTISHELARHVDRKHTLLGFKASGRIHASHVASIGNHGEETLK